VFQTEYSTGQTGLIRVFDNATLQSGGRNGYLANIFACNATVLLNGTIISNAFTCEGSGGGLCARATRPGQTTRPRTVELRRRHLRFQLQR
jgi:hypothetical protein